MLLLAMLIRIYTFVLLGAILITWVPIDRNHPIRQVLEMATEPVLAPIRKVLPDMGGIDLSPLVALIGLQLLGGLLLR